MRLNGIPRAEEFLVKVGCDLTLMRIPYDRLENCVFLYTLRHRQFGSDLSQSHSVRNSLLPVESTRAFLLGVGGPGLTSPEYLLWKVRPT